MNNEAAENANVSSERINLRILFEDTLKCLRKFWLIFLLIGLICAGAFYHYRMNSFVSMYESKSTLAVTSVIYDTSVDILYYEYYYSKSTAIQMANVFPYIISTSLLTDAVKEDLGVNYINGAISASLIQDTNLITLKVRSTSPQSAYDILRSVIKIYPSIARFVTGDLKISTLTEPSMPSSPVNTFDKTRNLLYGAAIGAAICCIFLIFYSLTRKTIRQIGDFKEKLNQNCISVLPKATFKKRKYGNDKTISVLNNKIGSAYLESARSLRTRIIKLSEEQNRKVFIVTSTLPNEGKTTVAINLALILGKADKKVALVDADLRNRSLRTSMKIADGTFGLLDIYDGTVSADKTPYRYLSSNVDIYSDTRKAAHPITVLGSQKTRDFIASLREKYDYVIIDTPPCSVLADATETAAACDGILYVVKQDYAKIGQIINGIQNISYSPVPISGFILNATEKGIGSYGYGYGYKYGYGYGYNYNYRYGYGYGYGGYGNKNGYGD